MPRRAVPEIEVEPEDSSSGEDAPEEVSVSSSRSQRVAQLKDMQDANRRRKDEEKRRRRERNEMFRAQKEKKLEDLAKRKLPQDVLDAVSGTKVAKSAKVSKGSEEKKEAEEESEEEEAGSDDQSGSEQENNDRLSDSGLEDEDVGNSDEPSNTFIPLSSGGHLAVATEQFLMKKKLTSAQKALDFKQNRLFNASIIPRQTTKQRRAIQAKKKALLKS